MILKGIKNMKQNLKKYKNWIIKSFQRTGGIRMKNYEYEQNENYESTKQMFEACRKDVGYTKRVRITIPTVNDEICFADIPENGVCITSQFENGLCGEIIWCRNGDDIYMLHSSIRLADHTVWLQMDKKGNGEALHLKLFQNEGNVNGQKDGFQGIYISPLMQVKRFYECCFWPNYIKGIKPVEEENLNLYEVLKRIIRCIGSDFQYDLETMQI